MRSELSTRGASTGTGTGPNWRGIGRVEVAADMRAAGVTPGAVLVVNFDRRHVAAGGPFLVDIGGRPELVQFRQFPRGLCARVCGRWVDVSGDDLRGMAVVGRVVKIGQDCM